jgi:hypothetical protein
MFFILLWCFVVLTYYWSARKVLAYTVTNGYRRIYWEGSLNLYKSKLFTLVILAIWLIWLLMLSVLRSLSKLLFFIYLSSKHVHFQYCQCFVSWPEEEVFALQFRLIWFGVMFGLSFLALATLRWDYNCKLGLDDMFFVWFEQPAS